MLELYTWSTPNGRKISIALEELGLDYEVKPIDISKGDTGITLMESGAILLYLAEKTGRLLPGDKLGYWETIQWLMWQKGGLGPMLGQAHHFLKFNPGKSSYAEERYRQEARRLYGVLNRQLAGRDFLAGGEYTIADIASWPWASRFEYQHIDLCEFPNVMAWYLRIAGRPAVQRGYAVPVHEAVPELPHCA